MAGAADPLDWDLVARTAKRFGGHEPFIDSHLYGRLEPDLTELAAQAEQLVTAETGLRPEAGPARIRITTRAGWIDANIASFQRLLAPLTRKLAEGTNRRLLHHVTRRLSAAELGTVLGWMSTRVLGQYDLLIVENERPEEQDLVYFVGPNVLALERRHDFPSRQFRLWLALHEVTHRAQFTGIPWLRRHFLSLIDDVLDVVEPDMEHLKQVGRRALEARRRGEDPLADGGLAGLLATPEQREVMDRIGGMMSLLEGHGDITMDRAGASHIPSADHFARVLRNRRSSARGVAKLLQRLIGIEAKLNQYAAGEAFIRAVEARDCDLLDRAWESAENLPTMPEIRDPQQWVDRVCEPPPLASSLP